MYVMMTMPATPTNKKILKFYIQSHDIHDWIVAKEEGKDGYRHYHVRMNARHTFEELKELFSDAHIEEAHDDILNGYERKGGDFVSSRDTLGARKCRFGTLTDKQKKVIEHLNKGGDRTITVWWDSVGCRGKTYLARWLFERGLALYVPPTVKDAKSLIQYVCSGYKGQPYIVIDIPRSTKWHTDLYVAIESIKDGLIYDTRYSAKMQDIWGVKILVTCNSKPNPDALSSDRWNIITEDDLYNECKQTDEDGTSLM